MRALLGCALVALGCGSAGGPPRGPDHDPANSPESRSSCPAEWASAKEARELKLGDESAAATERTARAVLAQADCEVGVLESGAFSAGTHEDVLAQITSATATHRDTKNLYLEVERYGVASLAGPAALGRGRLHRVFAARLAASPIPSDMTAIGEQSAYRKEVESLVAHFQVEAERALVVAIAADAVDPSTRQRACAELAAMGRTEVNGC